MVGCVFSVGGTESTTTPSEETMMDSPALLVATTVLYTLAPEGRGVVRRWRKEVWSRGSVVGERRSEPLGERPA